MNAKKLKIQVQEEVDTALLYKVLQKNETQKELATIFGQMSQIEMGHARRMFEKLQKIDTSAAYPKASFRARLKIKLSKYVGYGFILSELMSLEKKISSSIVSVKNDRGEDLDGGEFNHFEILQNISKQNGVSGNILAKFEGRHKSVGGNALRAAVLGANDGLVSNLSLIMGVAGAISDDKSIVITGLAGLFAGAISMAMGEWLSVTNSSELYEKQIALELEELENNPEEELLELTLIYQAKGIERAKAAEMAKKVFENKETALETLVQEELGIDLNDKLDSAWEAAITSFFLFVIGAIIPLTPFLLFAGVEAVYASLIFSTIGLFAIGAAITLFTGKTVLFSGMRQVAFGLIAAAITYSIGSVVGASL
jgi:VIT1/CCC1 family predicted Fe2+/Mn2+ transporter